MDKKVLIDGKFWASQQQADTLEALSKVHGGAFARVEGYVPTSGYVTPPKCNYTVLTRFSVERLYKRKLAALESITLSDVIEHAKKDPTLSDLTLTQFNEHFETRLQMECDSITKSLEGERDDNYRAAHDRCYYTVAPGVKVHFLTESVKTADGKKHKEPILENGFPVADSIMLAALIIKTEYVEQGEKKVVNSGVPVRISNCISALLNQRSVGYRTLSLKEGNFDRISIEHGEILSEDVKSLVD